MMGLVVLDGLAAVRLLQGALTALYLWGLLVPLLGYAWIETSALAPLMHYPLSPRQLFLGNLVAAVAQPSVLATLPLFLVLALSPLTIIGGLVGLLAVGLLLVHLLGMSQILTLLVTTALASRRVRDLGLIIVALIPFVMALVWLFAAHWAESDHPAKLQTLVEHPGWSAVAWLPSGWAALAMQGAREGQVGAVAVGLGLLGAAVAGTLVLGGRVVERAAWSEEGGDSTGGAVPRRAARAWVRFRDPVFEALVNKDLLLQWRDPRMRLMLAGTVFTAVLLVVIHTFFIGREVDATLDAVVVRPALLVGGATLLVLTEAAQLMNAFGYEGRGLAAVLATPAPRWKVLAAKNMALVGLMSVLNAGTLFVLGVVFGRLQMALLIWGITVVALVLLAAGGNVVSVLLPYPVVGLRRRAARPTPVWRAVFTEVLKMVALGAVLVVAAPPVVVIAALWVWHPLASVGAAAVAVVYAAALYTLTLAGGSVLLQAREATLAQAVAVAEG